LPIINNPEGSIISIAPYVDFEDKAYIYDHKSKKFIKNTNAKSKFKAEIWH
jgi:hypothetical protein